MYLASGDLLVPCVHQVAKGLKGVGGSEPSVPVGGCQVHLGGQTRVHEA